MRSRNEEANGYKEKITYFTDKMIRHINNKFTYVLEDKIKLPSRCCLILIYSVFICYNKINVKEYPESRSRIWNWEGRKEGAQVVCMALFTWAYSSNCYMWTTQVLACSHTIQKINNANFLGFKIQENNNFSFSIGYCFAFSPTRYCRD